MDRSLSRSMPPRTAGNQEWVESLKDYEAKARVFVRLERVR